MAGPTTSSFLLTDIPAAMTREGWPVGARLMRIWFAKAGYPMPDAVKRGNQAPPPRAIDTRSVTMDWAMAVPRFAAAQRTLVGTWSNPRRFGPTSGQIAEKVRAWVQTFRVDATKPFRFGDLSRRVPEIDMRCAVNREVVTSQWYGAVDDFYAAFGSALVRLAVSGMAEQVRGGWRVVIDEIGTYLRDAYDFNGDQPLGSWGPTGLSRMAVLAPEIEVDARKRAPSGGQRYWKVGNDSFRRYRAVTGMGGDFMVYSNLRRQRLSSPVTVMVRA